MTEPKETHEAFIADFKPAMAAKRPEFEALGIDMSSEDIGETLYNLFDYLSEHPTDEAVKPFVDSNRLVIGDLYWSSPYVQDRHPLTITYNYRGRAVSSKGFGASVYHDVYRTLWDYTQSVANSFIPTTQLVTGYLADEAGYRDQLMHFLDFQHARNWAIVWAKIDWIKTCFPKAYAKMMEDGEFLSVEEAEANIKS